MSYNENHSYGQYPYQPCGQELLSVSSSSVVTLTSATPDVLDIFTLEQGVYLFLVGYTVEPIGADVQLRGISILLRNSSNVTQYNQVVFGCGAVSTETVFYGTLANQSQFSASIVYNVTNSDTYSIAGQSIFVNGSGGSFERTNYSLTVVRIA